MVRISAFASLIACGPALAAAPKLDAVRIQLFYATSGTLSDDIAAPRGFAGWNTTTGAGDAREPATDLLVTARLSAPGDEADSGTPLTIKVTGPGGRLLAQRTVKDIFFKGGRSVQALYVRDATCAGQIEVEAQFGTQKRTAKVALDCGE